MIAPFCIMIPGYSLITLYNDIWAKPNLNICAVMYINYTTLSYLYRVSLSAGCNQINCLLSCDNINDIIMANESCIFRTG